MNRIPQPVVLLFLKAPRPGLVKTRLAAQIGDRGAVAVYRQLVAGQLERIPPGWPLELHFAPAEAAGEIVELAGPTHAMGIFAQRGDGLGERLETGLDAAAKRHPGRPLVAIGADCPGLDEAVFREAFAALEEQDLVLGPAADGGYYLIGMRRPHPEVFRGIDWSTGRVRAQTLERAQEAGIGVKEISMLEDVDDFISLQSATPEIARTVDTGCSP